MRFVKNSLVLILIFLFVSENTNSQCYSIRYKNLPALPDMGLKYFADNNVERPHSIYTMETNGVNSIYRYLESHPSGTVSNIFNNYYFKNNKMNEIHIIDLNNPDTLGTKFPAITSSSWKIYPDTFNIAGLKCFKASLINSNENTVAYYAIEIPINDGPERYNNLPGLIVRLEIVSSTIEMVDIRKIDDCNVITPESYNIKYITSKNWEKYILSGIDSFIKK